MTKMRNTNLINKIQIEFTLNAIVKLLIISVLIMGIIVLYNFNNKINEDREYRDIPIRVQIENGNRH